MPSHSESSWLKSLFRKHRKSFSFAEHIVAIQAISEGSISIEQAIQNSSNLPVSIRKPAAGANNGKAFSNQVLSSDQRQWLHMLNNAGPKIARGRHSALYARLYRSHHDWLIEVNEHYKAEKKSINHRVDWNLRDKHLAKELSKICRHLSDDLASPHLSKTYLINQLAMRSTIEKNLYRLPMCQKVLFQYVESIDEYQIRRLTRVYIDMKRNNKPIKRWKLLRNSRLSEERMTAITRSFLGEFLV